MICSFPVALHDKALQAGIERGYRMKLFLAESLGCGEHELTIAGNIPTTIYVDGFGVEGGEAWAEVEIVDRDGISLEFVCEHVAQEHSVIPWYDLPQATLAEYEAIKASVARIGIQQPVIVDEFGSIIAGRLRRRAADELGLNCPTLVVPGLTRQQKTQLAFEVDFCRKGINRDARKAAAKLLLTQSPTNSDQSIGRVAGIDHKTVGSYRRELEAGGEIPQVAVRIGGDGKTYKVPRVVANTPKELEAALEAAQDLPKNCAGKILDTTTAKRRARRNNKQRELAGRIVRPLADDAIRLYHCRFQELEAVAQIEPGSVNLICTDIPYDLAFLRQLEDLGAFAERVLVDGGIFVTYCGNLGLNVVLQHLGRHLSYRWTIASVWSGKANIFHPYTVASHWLPIVVFSKGKWTGHGKWGDVLQGAKEKNWHPWQRPLNEVETLVRYFSEPGDLVVDPCGGGFTTAEACLRLNRRCISCDVELESVQRGEERIAMVHNDLAAHTPITPTTQTGQTQHNSDQPIRPAMLQ